MGRAHCFLALLIAVPFLLAAQNTPDSSASYLSSADTVTSAGAPVNVVPLPAASTAEKTVEKDTVKKPAAIIEEIEEELILDGGEESLLPTAASEKTVKQPIAAMPTDSNGVISAAAVADSGKTAPDSSTATVTDTSTMPLVSPIPKPPEDTAKLRIDKMESINFANSLEEYRSPKIAILLSLLVPGTGQAYAKNYLKTGIFAAVEATFITIGAVFRINGNKTWKKAMKYADEHYSMTRYKEYYTALDGFFDSTVMYEIFQPDTNDSSFMKDADAKNDNYYDYIQRPDNPFVQGWDDVEPRFNSSFELVNPQTENGYYVKDDDSSYLVYFVNSDGDTSEVSQFGFSEHQKIYDDKRADANSQYRWSNTFFTMLIINHLASAIDAGITAKAYNDRLLGKRSVWQNINLRETLVATPDGPAQGLALEVRF